MTKEIIGRAKQKEQLNEALNSHRSELIAVYGRRRIGKTYLIREFFAKSLLFSFSGLRTGHLPDQLENFILELRDHSKQFYKEEPSSWLQAFHLLKQYLKTIRKTKKKESHFY